MFNTSTVHILQNHNPIAKSMLFMPMLVLVLCASCIEFLVFSIAFFALNSLFVKKWNVKSIIRYYKVPTLFILIGVGTVGLSIENNNEGLHMEYADGAGTLMLYHFCKSFAVFNAVAFWVFTNSISDITVFFRFIKLPSAFTELFLLIYKFIYYVINCSEQGIVSQKSRLGYTQLSTFNRDASFLFQTIIHRSFSLNKVLLQSMEARLFTGNVQFVQDDFVPVKQSVGVYVFPVLIYISFFVFI